jgi:hypothetical protein
MCQTIARSGCAQVSLKTVQSKDWIENYKLQPRLVERVREISRLGTRDMGLLGGIFKPNLCEKRATATLLVLGEQALKEVPSRVRGHALLCYDSRAAPHVGAVKTVLDHVGMPWVS